MSWSTTADIATTVGTFVALVGVAGSLALTLRSEALTRRGQELEREQAGSAAARSEAAAALTEEYTRRVVEALEAMATGSAAPVGVRSSLGVRWTMRNHGGDTYIVENIGDATAEGVTLTADESMIFNPPEVVDVAPGEAVTFMAALSLATRDSTITVEWSERGSDDMRTWKYPLPPRPPRSH
jgi:hypothetical protein